MNIQFCLYHRLEHLGMEPAYTTDLMGVAVQVDFLMVHNRVTYQMLCHGEPT